MGEWQEVEEVRMTNDGERERGREGERERFTGPVVVLLPPHPPMSPPTPLSFLLYFPLLLLSSLTLGF